MTDGFPIHRIDYLIIGHVTKDLTPEGPVLGGTATYAGLTARAIGARVGVVTSSGPDLDLSPLSDLEVVTAPSPQSTTFQNTYHADGRHQLLLGRANTLTWESVPERWRATGIVHLAPLASEVAPDLLGRFPSSILGATPQGWNRQWDESGRVTPKDWRELIPLVSQASAAILSIEDVGWDEAAVQELSRACPLLVVTVGERGARVFAEGHERLIPAPTVREVDPTGAGDVFAACFLWWWARTQDPWQSARFANQLAAASVTRSGLASIPTPSEAESALRVFA